MNTDPATKPNLFIFAFTVVWRRTAHFDEIWAGGNGDLSIRPIKYLIGTTGIIRGSGGHIERRIVRSRPATLKAWWCFGGVCEAQRLANEGKVKTNACVRYSS